MNSILKNLACLPTRNLVAFFQTWIIGWLVEMSRLLVVSVIEYLESCYGHQNAIHIDEACCTSPISRLCSVHGCRYDRSMTRVSVRYFSSCGLLDSYNSRNP